MLRHMESPLPPWCANLMGLGWVSGAVEIACYLRYGLRVSIPLHQWLMGPTMPGWLHWANAACVLGISAGAAAFTLREGWGHLG